VLSDLTDLAGSMLTRDPMTAAVGLRGATFDARRARLVSATAHGAERSDPVPVDYIGGNAFPYIRVGAIRQVGPFAEELFFAWDDLEYGLRLRRSGFSLYAPARRPREVKPSWRLGEPSLRRYYKLRNLIYIMRRHGRTGAAIRLTLVRGLAKPLANMALSPRAAAGLLAMNVRACRDGWAGRMGRTMEPDSAFGRRVSRLATR